jgi:serine/threonine protein kinase
MANPSAGETNGVTLEQYVTRKGGRLDPDWAVRILTPVMESVAALHGRGSVHGSINPQHVFLANTGAVQLLDGDGARQPASTGDPCAAPERYAAAGAMGPWSDVYSLAATLYWAITGFVPPPSVARSPSDEIARPSALGVDLSPYVEAAILKALNVEPGRRFASMTAFESALRALPPASSPASDAGKTRDMKAIPPIAETRPIAVPASLPLLSSAESTRPMAARPVKSVHRPIPIWVVALAILALGGQVWWMLQEPFTKHAPPTIDRFTATPSHIQAGQTTVLEWSASDPADVVLDPGNQALARVGSVAVQPIETVTLKLTARNQYGVASQQVTIEVTGRAPSRRGRTPRY